MAVWALTTVQTMPGKSTLLLQEQARLREVPFYVDMTDGEMSLWL